MKNKPPLTLFFLLFSLQFVYSLDFTIQGGIDSLFFNSDNSVDSFSMNSFSVDSVNANAALKGDFAGMYNYNVNFGRDQMWHNVASGDIGYYFGNVNIGAGFFTGMSDFTFEYIDIGISGRAGIEFPGVFLLNAGIASSVNNTNSPETDARRLITAQFGFWLPHIFVTADLQIKDYFEQTEETINIHTSRTRYRGSIEIFSKNVPYRLRFSFGQQILNREIDDSGSLQEYSYKTLIPGFHFYNQVSNTFAWFIEGEVPFNMDDATDIQAFYNASMGFIFSYPER
jgi:hypothetical protein